VSTPAPQQAPSADAELGEFGYPQELHRGVGYFASFAAGFSFVSILTTVFQLFGLGFSFGGVAFFWTWPAVFVGQLLVAVVATDGSAAAIERARTVLETGLPTPAPGFAPETISESNARHVELNTKYRQLAEVVTLTSLPIAGCTLAVGVVAGLNDRRRPFALLRLTGARLATLRRVVVLESAVPLLVTRLERPGSGDPPAARRSVRLGCSRGRSPSAPVRCGRRGGGPDRGRRP
jgi:hypothetical protein